jgi:hypothetical protein
MSKDPFICIEPKWIRAAGFALRPALAALAWSAVISSAVFAGVFYPDGATTLHFAFEGSPNGDRPIVRPPAFYHADDGFGFVDSPDLIGTALGVTAPTYFQFDVNLPAGTYDVTVTLGGTPGESITSIKAEHLPTAVQDVHVVHGQSAVKTFTVIVKPRAVGSAAPGDDARLVLEFAGTNPSLMKLDVKPTSAPSGV